MASISTQSSGHSKPRTLGELKRIPDFDSHGASRSVKDELRRNLLRAIEKGETLFPGIHGYEDTVVPQIVNALLSRHNFILLGLRGQAKSRILRGLINLLDPEMPVVAGCEINDDPLNPICRACREKIATEGDNTPIAWMPRENRFVEKLATPDVTMADIIGDVDPIRAARGGRDLSDELTIHYGLLPRANRGIFPISPAKSRSVCLTSCKKAIFRLRATRCAFRSTSLLFSPQIPRTTPRAGKSSRRSKTASAPKFARTIHPLSKKAWPSPPKNPGLSAMPDARSKFPRICATWWKRLPSRPARTSASTAVLESASGFRLRRWRVSSAVLS